MLGAIMVNDAQIWSKREDALRGGESIWLDGAISEMGFQSGVIVSLPRARNVRCLMDEGGKSSWVIQPIRRKSFGARQNQEFLTFREPQETEIRLYLP